MPLSIVVLAAGHGVRMRSDLPKVLHPLGGRPFITRVVETASQLSPAQLIVVHGQHHSRIKQALIAFPEVLWADQPVALGTGDAVRQALPLVGAGNRVLILLGDVPLIRSETLLRFLKDTPAEAVGLLTTQVADPTGFGRILRDAQGQILRIVEEKDATPAERRITEINTGIFLVPESRLHQWLPQITRHHPQGEVYFTAIVPMALAAGVTVTVTHPESAMEVCGVNDRCQLAQLERAYQYQQALHWLAEGVSIADPHRFDVRGEITLTQGASIDVDVILEGTVSVGANTSIGAFCYIKNCDIGENVQILPHSYLEGAVIGAGCRVGPFARIRPHTTLAADVRIGNFVEVKESTLGAHARVNHLSYIGNTQMGASVNVGAGTVVCNYDGVHKHETTIEPGAFIGSGSLLVAPVTVGHDATLGAGTVLTHDAPPEKLTLRRAPQRTVEGWKRPQRPEEEKEL